VDHRLDPALGALAFLTRRSAASSRSILRRLAPIAAPASYAALARRRMFQALKDGLTTSD
jgi:hypothetical protein